MPQAAETRAKVNHDPYQGTIAQPRHTVRLNGAQQVASLVGP